jgi:Ca-activated chloride channel family protein
MRRTVLCLLVALLVGGPAWAQANPQKLVTLDFENADLVYVLKTLAKEMGVKAYLGPTVQGTVSITLKNVPAEQAVRQVLALQANKYGYFLHKLTPNLVLVVAPPGQLKEMSGSIKTPIDTVRMEYLLDEAPSAKVLDFLKGQHPNVEFTLHPTKNGFYARGSREDLLQIKRELANLDRVPEPPPLTLREYSVGQTITRNPSGKVARDLPSAPRPAGRVNRAGYVGLPPGDIEAESYESIDETGYREVSKRPLSTFSIDVDTASYANVRRFLKEGRLPPADAVRVEELINYFTYDYPQPKDDLPFSVTTELSDCPWNAEHQLLRVGLQGRRTEAKKTPPRNLVFLLDVSGSMASPAKLPLVKKSMQLLLSTMSKQDRVAIVVYAGSQGLALPSTSCDEKSLISEKIEMLRPEGSTNGSAGIQLAYQIARENFKKGAINRVILATDGDFNVGLTGGSLISLIEKEREGGIFLTVLGFGTGNVKDDTMESLADKGNGNYAYIDSLLEAQKVLVRESGSTLETIAKDVKLQIEFNPKRVHSYRLVGYENRRLEDEDFANDKKDAGELGAGHNVTALYELVTEGSSKEATLRYQNQPTTTDKANGEELALVKLRYKEPTGDTSRLLEMPIANKPVTFAKASQDLRFAASVAAFGMLLRDSEFKGKADFGQVSEWANSATGKDPHGDRHEFLKLVELASSLKTVASGTK